MAARPCSTPWETYSKLLASAFAGQAACPPPYRESRPDRRGSFFCAPENLPVEPFPLATQGAPNGNDSTGQKVPLVWRQGLPPGANGFHFFEKIQEVPVGKSCLPAKNSRHKNQKKPPSVKKLDGIFFPKNACIFQSPRNSGIIFFLARDMHLKGVRNEPDAISLSGRGAHGKSA